MRIVVHGQQAFGKAVLLGFMERGGNIVGVFCAPDRKGRPSDPLKEFAIEKGVPVHQLGSWETEEAANLMRGFEPDLCIMAYVTLFVPVPVLDIPRHGTIQYHPSLLPRHRGASAANWPIIQGKTRTGLTIFWPDEGLDEGPILLQKEVEISPDDTAGSLYFNHLIPLGVDAMVEAVDLIRDGNAPRIDQDNERATYESWCRKADAEIDWSKPVAEVYNLIRGTNPRPGALTTAGENELKIFDSDRVEATGTPGEVVDVSDAGITVAGSGGGILVRRVRPHDGDKLSAADYAVQTKLGVGTRLGSQGA